MPTVTKSPERTEAALARLELHLEGHDATRLETDLREVNAITRSPGWAIVCELLDAESQRIVDTYVMGGAMDERESGVALGAELASAIPEAIERAHQEALSGDGD